MLLIGVQGTGFAMEVSPQDDLSAEQRQQMAMASLFAASPTVVVEEEMPQPVAPAAPLQKVIARGKVQGLVTDTEIEGLFKQTFGKATAIEDVKQGDVSGATISGNATQQFGKATAGGSISQGNISGSTFAGDLEQTFGDDD